MWDTLLLMALALVVFGPRRLPLIGRQIGKLMYEFRKASNDFKFQMEEELRNAEEAERRQKEETERQRTLAAAPAPQLEQTVSQAAEPTTATSESTPPAPASTESPYPNETPGPRHPNLAADETRAEEPTPPASEVAASPAAEPSAPRIQPPSTGKTVAAERPGAQPQRHEPAAPTLRDPAQAPESVIPEAERSEPAARHG